MSELRSEIMTVKLDADATAWGAWKRMIRAAQEQGDG